MTILDLLPLHLISFTTTGLHHLSLEHTLIFVLENHTIQYNIQYKHNTKTKRVRAKRNTTEQIHLPFVNVFPFSLENFSLATLPLSPPGRHVGCLIQATPQRGGAFASSWFGCVGVDLGRQTSRVESPSGVCASPLDQLDGSVCIFKFVNSLFELNI